MMVLGIDPGGRSTGLVVIDGDEPVDGTVAVHVRPDDVTPAQYGLDVCDWLWDQVLTHDRAVDLVAIEGVVAPNPHMGLSNPAGIVDTGVVFGSIWAAIATQLLPPALVEVRPAGHGDQPARLYPPALRGRAPRAGAGDRKHARSAYDVALAGRRLHRIGAAA